MNKCKREGCENEVSNNKNIFCSMSCSAKHNNKGKRRWGKSPELKPCKGCGKEIFSTFCSNVCEREYRWKTVTIPKILRGEGSFYSLRMYHIRTNGNVCVICGNKGIHNGIPLIMQCDHIDGNPDNNTLENTRMLCPNCHSQTPTYKGGNKKTPKQDLRSKKQREYRASKK